MALFTMTKALGNQDSFSRSTDDPIVTVVKTPEADQGIQTHTFCGVKAPGMGTNRKGRKIKTNWLQVNRPRRLE